MADTITIYQLQQEIRPDTWVTQGYFRDRGDTHNAMTHITVYPQNYRVFVREVPAGFMRRSWKLPNGKTETVEYNQRHGGMHWDVENIPEPTMAELEGAK